MNDTLTFTVLGCGSSGGVPRLADRPGGEWGACDPTNPKNRRRRCSMLVRRSNAAGHTTVLIDTSPDMRQQLLDAGTGVLDAVMYTHAHADHVNGLDDLRMCVFNTGVRLPVWADDETATALSERFGYVFVQPDGSPYPPICALNRIVGNTTITGAGGPVTFEPLSVRHGNINALGFRINTLAYIPDVSDIPDDIWPRLRDLDYLVVDALRRKPHPTHSHLANTLDWINQAAPRYAVLTNMHNDLDYATVAAETPPHVTPAHDGMKLTLPVV